VDSGCAGKLDKEIERRSAKPHGSSRFQVLRFNGENSNVGDCSLQNATVVGNALMIAKTGTLGTSDPLDP
jgi:hypothetical protein